MSFQLKLTKATSPQHLFELYNPTMNWDDQNEEEQKYWIDEFAKDPYCTEEVFIDDLNLRYINK